MPSFDSPQFKMNVPSSNQQPMREYTVGDPGDLPQTMSQQSPITSSFVNPIDEAQIQKARAQRAKEISGEVRITPGAKKRIELLSDTGRLTRDVKIGEHTYTLRTLKAKETKEAALASFSTVDTQLEASYEVRRQQLARALFQIDGHPIEDVIESNELSARIDLIDEWQEIVVNKLFDEFNILRAEAQKLCGISSPEQAKEVVEDLKK